MTVHMTVHMTLHLTYTAQLKIVASGTCTQELQR